MLSGAPLSSNAFSISADQPWQSMYVLVTFASELLAWPRATMSGTLEGISTMANVCAYDPILLL